MKQELEILLWERYPKIFGEHKLQERCMGRGFECGDGWFNLIDALCESLQFWTDQHQAPQIDADQVKEKWGELRFYARSASAEQRGAIEMARAMSFRVCEICGKPGQTLVSGAHLTRCPEHAPHGSMTLEEFHSAVKTRRG